MRKNTKIGLVVTIILFLIVSLYSLYYFSRPQVNVVLSNEENILIGNFFHNKVFAPYRIKKSIYPKVENSKYYFFTPIAAIKSENDHLNLSNSCSYGLNENNSFDLYFLGNEESRWKNAINIDKKLKTALIYNESNNNENSLSEKIKADLKIPYVDFISFINADEIKAELDRNQVGTILVLNPSSAINLIEICKDMPVVVSSLYGMAIGEIRNTYVLQEDFDYMLRYLVRGEVGLKETIYSISSTKKGLKVIFDYLF